MSAGPIKISNAAAGVCNTSANEGAGALISWTKS